MDAHLSIYLSIVHGGEGGGGGMGWDGIGVGEGGAPVLKRCTLEIPPRNLCELFFFHHARAKNRNGVGS